jgi:hypothetical protein
MRGGFASQVAPSAQVSEVDLDGSKDHRAWVHHQVRVRQHLMELLGSAPVDAEMVQVSVGEAASGGRSGPERHLGPPR